MIQKILHSDFIRGNRVYGLHYSMDSAGNILLRAMLLVKKKNEIEFEEKELEFRSVEEFMAQCDKSIPIMLTFDNRQVLSKKVKIEEDKSDIEYLLPNATEKDFYLDEWLLSDDQKYIAAVRRDVVDPVMKELHDNGFMILRLFLGPLAIQNLKGISQDFEQSFYAHSYQVQYENEIPEIKKTKDPENKSYSVGSDFVTSHHVLCLASAISFFILQPDDTGNLVIDRENYLYKQMFVKSGWAILIFIFALLLINYMMYMRFDSQRSQLSATYNQNVDLLSSLDTLRKEVNFKETFFGDKGFLERSVTSYYSDRIAASVPRDISLTDMNVYPLQNQVKEKENIEFSYDVIYISGTTIRSVILYQWIETLESFDWIKNVEIQNWEQGMSTKPGLFTLNVEIE